MNKKSIFLIILCALTGNLLESKGPPKEEPKKKRRHSFFKFALDYKEDALLLENETITDEADEVTNTPS